jgi:hypothetical protein
MRFCVHLIKYLPEQENVLSKYCRERTETHISCPMRYVRKSFRFGDNYTTASGRPITVSLCVQSLTSCCPLALFQFLLLFKTVTCLFHTCLISVVKSPKAHNKHLKDYSYIFRSIQATFMSFLKTGFGVAHSSGP